MAKVENCFPEAECKPIVLREALAESPVYMKAPVLTGKQAFMAKKIPPYGNGADVTGGSWFTSQKFAWDKPARSILKHAGQFYHPDTSENFSIGELRRIHSYPDLFMFSGSWRDASSRIGNSVPPLMMRAIATRIRAECFNGQVWEPDNNMDYPAILAEAWGQHLAPRAVNAPTVVSTFAGCGGSSLGYSMAGYRELLAVEWDDNAVETFKLNFPDVPVYHGDIAKLTVEEALKLTGLQPGELDVLDGSPPCQGFSTAGKREMSDDRNQLFREYVRLLRGLRPKVFVMENVSGMVKGKMKLIFAEIMRELKASGYKVSCRLLNAMYFHVPQSRQRLIFIGVRDDLAAEPSHPNGTGRIISCGECVKGADTTGTPLFNDAYAALWEQVPRGGNAADVIGKGYNSCCIPCPTKPAPTLPKTQTGRGFATIAHWAEKRALSIGEAKRISSYPDSMCFVGTYSEQWARIGNSVPPLMMRAIAQHIRDYLLT